MTPIIIASGTVFTAFVVNLAWAKVTGYPFLTCWVGSLFWPLIHSWLTWVVVLAVGYVVFGFFIRSHLVRAVALVVMVLFVPDVASAVLMGGGSCERIAKHIPAESKRHGLFAKVHDMFGRHK